MRMQLFRKCLGLLTFCLATLPASLSAQSTFGTVRGSILDASGAAISEAQIILHSIDENSNVLASSNDHGDFTFENLKPRSINWN